MPHARETKSATRAWVAAGLAVLGFACTSPMKPPSEPGPFRETDLVELLRLDPSLRLDVRYATDDNFVGRPLYPEARAFLQRPAAEALVRVHRNLALQGLGIVVFDGYRPWSVTLAFWEAATPEQRAQGFVADPAGGSRHNRGCAADVTLFDRATGETLPMPSAYDDFTERAHPSYTGGSDEARSNRDRLRLAMEAEGFSVYENEWWHFDHRDWREYEILDVPFEEIEPAGGS